MVRKIILFTLIAMCMFTLNSYAMDLPEYEIIDSAFIPYLYNNPEHAMVFAAEINISNGNPTSRDFGERYMFGKLVTYQYVYENMEELLLIDEERIIDEVVRLLVGDWYNNGSTTFSFKKLKGRKVFDFDKKSWIKKKEVNAIKVEHITEYANKKRVSYVAYDKNNGEYCFSIVK